MSARPALRRRSAYRAVGPRGGQGGLVALALVGAVAAVLAIFLLDAPAARWYRELAPSTVAPFRYVTLLGNSGVVLWPTGIALVVLLLARAASGDRRTGAFLSAIAARFALVFTAVAVPGLAVAIVKRVIGRVRPHDFDAGGHLAFDPFAWTNAAASLPSGHATTAFAAAVALGALWPRARAPLFVVAGLVALSRVVLGSHYPSDVIAGAVCGTLAAALIVRAFAARRLALKVSIDGRIEPMAGPSARRLGALAAGIFGARRRGAAATRP